MTDTDVLDDREGDLDQPSLPDRIEALATELEDFDNGAGEGLYFAQRLRELLK